MLAQPPAVAPSLVPMIKALMSESPKKSGLLSVKALAPSPPVPLTNHHSPWAYLILYYKNRVLLIILRLKHLNLHPNEFYFQGMNDRMLLEHEPL